MTGICRWMGRPAYTGQTAGCLPQESTLNSCVASQNNQQLKLGELHSFTIACSGTIPKSNIKNKCNFKEKKNHPSHTFGLPRLAPHTVIAAAPDNHNTLAAASDLSNWEVTFTRGRVFLCGTLLNQPDLQFLHIPPTHICCLTRPKPPLPTQ